MNSKLLIAAMVAAASMTACDSRDTARDDGNRNVDQTVNSPGTPNTVSPGNQEFGERATAGGVTSGTSVSGAPLEQTDSAKDAPGDLRPVDRQNLNYLNNNKKLDRDPDSDGALNRNTTVGDDLADDDDVDETDLEVADDDVVESNDPIVSGSTMEPTDGQASDSHVWSDTDEVNDDDDISSGSTMDNDDASVTYKQTPHRGGIAPQDRNLRYGLVGNGTGIGLEDTTSKYMTDNDTISDPLVISERTATSGATSAPVDELGELEDIKSGTSFDAERYEVEDLED
jgi:hypothetical protein